MKTNLAAWTGQTPQSIAGDDTPNYAPFISINKEPMPAGPDSVTIAVRDTSGKQVQITMSRAEFADFTMSLADNVARVL